jgi:hypothetical protein
MLRKQVETLFNAAINDTANINQDGSINWNFVEADIFLSIPNSINMSTEIENLFNEFANKVVDNITV